MHFSIDFLFYMHSEPAYRALGKHIVRDPYFHLYKCLENYNCHTCASLSTAACIRCTLLSTVTVVSVTSKNVVSGGS